MGVFDLNYMSALPCLPILTSGASAFIIATSGSVLFEDRTVVQLHKCLNGNLYELEGNNCLDLPKSALGKELPQLTPYL